MNYSAVYHKPVACHKCGCSQDLPADLQSCECHCHPANWPANAAPGLLDACIQFTRWINGGPMTLGDCARQARAAIAKTEAAPL